MKHVCYWGIIYNDDIREVSANFGEILYKSVVVESAVISVKLRKSVIKEI
jgi:hypothetical protein